MPKKASAADAVSPETDSIASKTSSVDSASARDDAAPKAAPPAKVAPAGLWLVTGGGYREHVEAASEAEALDLAGQYTGLDRADLTIEPAKRRPVYGSPIIRGIDRDVPVDPNAAEGAESFGKTETRRGYERGV